MYHEYIHTHSVQLPLCNIVVVLAGPQNRQEADDHDSDGEDPVGGGHVEVGLVVEVAKVKEGGDP